MKRVLIASLLAILLLAPMAFADFYAELTTDPLEPAISLETGIGIVGTLAELPDASLSLDLWTGIENILGWPNPWEVGFLVSLGGTEITLDLGMEFEFDQEEWSELLLLTQWDTTAKITGHPGDITQVWGKITFTCTEENMLFPDFEFGVRVEIPSGMTL